MIKFFKLAFELDNKQPVCQCFVYKQSEHKFIVYIEHLFKYFAILFQFKWCVYVSIMHLNVGYCLSLV